MYPQELKDFILTTIWNSNTNTYNSNVCRANNKVYKANTKSFDDIVLFTSFLDASSTWSERYYCILNDISSFNTCTNINCNTVMSKWNGIANGYKKYCSSKCISTCEIINAKKIATNLEKYGVEHPQQSLQVRKKTEDTNLEKYGSKTPLQNETCKQKIKQTKLEKYDDENYNNQEKYKQNSLEKYGVEHPWMLESVQQDRKETMIKLYGSDNPSKIKEFQDKKIVTNLEKYGVEHYSKSNESKQKAKDANLEKYGVEHPWMLESVQQDRKENWVKLWGVDNPSYKHITQSQVDMLKDVDFMKEYSVREVMKITGVTQSTVSKYMIAHKISNGFKSSGELDIYNYLRTIYNGEIIINKRGLGTEIDLYIPEFKFAIEYNGAYYHSTEFKERQAHKKKFDILNSQGIYLFQFFDFEWIDDIKREIIESKIKLQMQMYENKIFARKCSIQLVSVKDSTSFLEFNHLDGSAKSSIKIGLYYEDKLVSLMTFGKSRFNKDEYELIRFVNKTNTIVVGGASKLFKHFKKMNITESIISYSNNFYSNGNLYTQLGFTEISESLGYFYEKQYIKYNRLQFQKSKLENKLKKYDSTISESENMFINGYHKIVDAGQKKWKITL